MVERMSGNLLWRFGDIAMPEGSGLEVLHQLRTLKPGLQILILSMYPERQYAVRALKAGAAAVPPQRKL